MPTTAEEIVAAAIQLPESERLEIVSRLLETIGEEVNLPDMEDPDFIEEMKRRRDDLSDSVPWSQIRDED